MTRTLTKPAFVSSGNVEMRRRVCLYKNRNTEYPFFGRRDGDETRGSTGIGNVGGSTGTAGSVGFVIGLFVRFFIDLSTDCGGYEGSESNRLESETGGDLPYFSAGGRGNRAGCFFLEEEWRVVREHRKKGDVSMNLKGRRGSASVFLCLMLSALFLFQTTLLDTAKILIHGHNMGYRLESAVQSVLAGFDTALMETYGLYGKKLEGSSVLQKELSRYFPGNADGSGVSWRETGFLPLPGLSYRQDVILEAAAPLSDLSVLKTQILQQMKSRTPKNLLEWVLEQLGLLSFSEELSECYQKYAEAAELQREAADALQKCKKIVEGVYQGDYACVNGFLRSPLQELEQKAMGAAGLVLAGWREGEDAIDIESDAYRAAKAEFIRAVGAIQFDLTVYRNYNLDAAGQLQKLAVLRSHIEKQTEQLENWIDQHQADSSWEQHQLDALAEQCAELRRQAALLSQTAVREGVEKNIRCLQNAITCTEEVLTCFSEHDDTGIPYSSLSDALEGIRSIPYSGPFRVIMDREEGQAALLAQDKREEAVQAAKQLPDSLSSRHIPQDEFAAFPSQSRSVSEKTEPLSIGSLQSISSLKQFFTGQFSFRAFFAESFAALQDGILVDDYILSYFGSRGEPITSRYAFWNSEVEYVIAGFSSEKANQNAVRDRLLGLRFVLNFLHVAADQEKRILADQIGTALAGAFSMGFGGPVYTILILAGWALGEASLDVKDLLEGKSVPLLKTKQNWKLGIEGLLSGQDGGAGGTEEAEKRFSLDYHGYCRLLLLSVRMSTKLLRVSDLIEWNLTQEGYGRYSLGQVFTSFPVHGTFFIPLTSPVLQAIYGDRKAEYQMEESYVYSY